MKAVDPVTRLLSRVCISDSGCWLFTGGQDRQGYGRIKAFGRAALAHRVAYEAMVGTIPDGLELDHICRVRNCVNPDHLDPVPHSVNVIRGESPAALHGRLTHCKRGHDLTQAHIDPKGRRVCMECVRERRAA